MDIYLRGEKSKLIRAVNRINNRGFPYKDEFLNKSAAGILILLIPHPRLLQETYAIDFAHKHLEIN